MRKLLGKPGQSTVHANTEGNSDLILIISGDP